MKVDFEYIQAFNGLGCPPKLYGQYLIEKNIKKRGGVRRKKRR